MIAKLKYQFEQEIFGFIFECECKGRILEGFKFCPTCGKEITEFEKTPTKKEQEKLTKEGLKVLKKWLKNHTHTSSASQTPT